MGKRLEGKVALITGAGNGKGSNGDFLQLKAHKVVAVDIMEGSLEKWKGNENIISLYADITKEEDIEKMVSTAEKEFANSTLFATLPVSTIYAIHWRTPQTKCGTGLWT